jgi:hypothetical protein
VLVVVNASLDATGREESLKFWLDSVQQLLHRQGPPRLSLSCDECPDHCRLPVFAIQVVASKCDCLTAAEQLACRTQLANIVSHWKQQQRPQRHHHQFIADEPLLLSGTDVKAGDRIDKLRQQLEQLCTTLLRNWRVKYVPKSFHRALQIIEQAQASDSLPALALIDELCSHRLFAWLQREHEYRLEIVDYLHSVGSVTVSPSRQFVCLDVQLLAKLMAEFINSSAEQLHGNEQRNRKDPSIMPKAYAIRQIDQVLERECRSVASYRFVVPSMFHTHTEREREREREREIPDTT